MAVSKACSAPLPGSCLSATEAEHTGFHLLCSFTFQLRSRSLRPPSESSIDIGLVFLQGKKITGSNLNMVYTHYIQYHSVYIKYSICYDIYMHIHNIYNHSIYNIQISKILERQICSHSQVIFHFSFFF